MVINASNVGYYSWLQKGYEYGTNDSGPWQRFTRRGLNTDIEQWYQTLVNAGWIVKVTREVVNSTSNQGISTIEANCGWAFPWLYGIETPENIWEIDPEDAQKNLLEADFPFSYTSGLNSVNLSSKLTSDAITKIIQDDAATWYPSGTTDNPSAYGIAHANQVAYLFDDGNLTVAAPAQPAASTSGSTVVANAPTGTYTFVHLPSADYAAAYSLYLLMKAGNEVFPMEASVIRHSQLTSNQYAVKASYNNMSRLISTASMYSLEGVPTTLLFNVPALPTAAQFIETMGDLQYGWRKVRPAVSRLSRMKWRIVQNYQFGLWPIRTFGSVL